MWWRVELDKTGKVKRCTEVEASEKGTRTVRFVEAMTRDEAKSFAESWYERRKAYVRKSDAKRFAERKANKQCLRCKTTVGPESTVLCSAHFEQQKTYHHRHRNGLAEQREPVKAEDAHARRLAYQRKRYNLAVQLPDVLAKYDELDGRTSPFRSWLLSQLIMAEAGLDVSEPIAAE